MSRFDDELRRASRPLAHEPLPDGILDEALDASRSRPRPLAFIGAVAALIVVVVVAGIGFGALRSIQLGSMPTPSVEATPLATPSSSAPRQPSPTVVPTMKSSPSPTSTPTPSATLVPSEPITATVEQEGIRLTLTLDRDRTAYGQRVIGTAVIENIGAGSVFWGHSGTCVWPASIAARAASPGVIPYGRDDWPGDLGTLKEVTVDASDVATSYGYQFRPVDWLDTRATMACTTDLQVSELLEGGTLTQVVGWDSMGLDDMPLEPGPYNVEGGFAFMARGARPVLSPPPDGFKAAVTLPLTIVGPPLDQLSRGEAVDVVLADPSFQSLLADAPRTLWLGSSLDYDDGIWTMTLRLGASAQDVGVAREIVATVDAASGTLLGVKMRDIGPAD